MNAIDILPYLQTGPFWLFHLLGAALVGSMALIWCLWRLPWNPLRKRLPTFSFRQMAVASFLLVVVGIALLQVAFHGTAAKLVKAREVADVYNAIDIPGGKLRFVQNDGYSALCVLGVIDSSGQAVAQVELWKEEHNAILAALAAKSLRFRDLAPQELLAAYLAKTHSPGTETPSKEHP